MAHLARKAFQLTPTELLYQQKRYRGKINLKKPKIFYTKAVVNELLKPFYIDPNKDKTLDELCTNALFVESKNELSPYDKILKKELCNWIENSKMVALIHVNSITEEDKFEVRVPLKRANMYYKFYSPHIVRAALENSPYQALDPLISKFTAFVFSPDINVTALEKILKKCKQMYTMGGVLDGHVLVYDDFLKYGKMDITTAHLGLVQALQNAGGVTLNRQLTHHQATLVSRLQQIGTNEKTTDEDKKPVPV
ncbi:large ribosomal subunit protein uL10m-like [Andrena cerasifolii]|uniref:large ribosomal subunit protein uL10m-like n=1 Tax=Andrena cerasifolii TaxID=2819439 RepID=UPI004037D32E